MGVTETVAFVGAQYAAAEDRSTAKEINPIGIMAGFRRQQ
jgi:hypothetical protein